MPDWVTDAFVAYSNRMPAHINIELKETPVGGRSGRSEEDLLLKNAASADLVIALDEKGKSWTSAELAANLEDWMQRTPKVALLIGGPDGLSDQCKLSAGAIWSISKLTLPHGLVRVVLIEQLYRAWTILQGHPYHRA